MKRAFLISEITTPYDNIKALLKACKPHLSKMNTYADKTEELLTEESKKQRKSKMH